MAECQDHNSAAYYFAQAMMYALIVWAMAWCVTQRSDW